MDHDYSVTGLVIGCAIDVHKKLGPGLKENSCENALCEALSRKSIKFERERTFKVKFEKVAVGKYLPDLIVENLVVVEVKSVDRLTPPCPRRILHRSRSSRSARTTASLTSTFTS